MHLDWSKIGLFDLGQDSSMMWHSKHEGKINLKKFLKTFLPLMFKSIHSNNQSLSHSLIHFNLPHFKLIPAKLIFAYLWFPNHNTQE